MATEDCFLSRKDNKTTTLTRQWSPNRTDSEAPEGAVGWYELTVSDSVAKPTGTLCRQSRIAMLDMLLPPPCVEKWPSESNQSLNPTALHNPALGTDFFTLLVTFFQIFTHTGQILKIMANYWCSSSESEWNYNDGGTTEKIILEVEKISQIVLYSQNNT